MNLKEQIQSCEKRLIEAALLANDGNVTKTARELNISFRTLHNKIKRLNIDTEQIRIDSI